MDGFVDAVGAREVGSVARDHDRLADRGVVLGGDRPAHVSVPPRRVGGSSTPVGDQSGDATRAWASLRTGSAWCVRRAAVLAPGAPWSSQAATRLKSPKRVSLPSAPRNAMTTSRSSNLAPVMKQ